MKSDRILEAIVIMLDSTSKLFVLPHTAIGQELFDAVVDNLQLVEYDYFDLEYTNKSGRNTWLDHLRPIRKQENGKEFNYRFIVKFYTPHPNLLEDELTRYLFALQIRNDLSKGQLKCTSNTSALLAAFITQAEIGDFQEELYIDTSYLDRLTLLTSMNEELKQKIIDCHKNLIGQSPSEADYNLLDTVRKVESYGVRLCQAKDSSGLKIHLTVAHIGIMVYQDSARINVFSWALVRKVSFKRKRFYIKIQSDQVTSVEFSFDSRDECKSFWKQCIEHHAFFRCQSVPKPIIHRGLMFSKGSSFRYSGRTQKQLIEHVRENYVKLPQFERKSNSSGRTLSCRLGGGTQSTRFQSGAVSDGAQTLARPQSDPAQRINQQHYLTDSCVPSNGPIQSVGTAGTAISHDQLPNLLARSRRAMAQQSSTGGTASSAGSYTAETSPQLGESPRHQETLLVQSPQHGGLLTLVSTNAAIASGGSLRLPAGSLIGAGGGGGLRATLPRASAMLVAPQSQTTATTLVNVNNNPLAGVHQQPQPIAVGLPPDSSAYSTMHASLLVATSPQPGGGGNHPILIGPPGGGQSPIGRTLLLSTTSQQQQSTQQVCNGRVGGTLPTAAYALLPQPSTTANAAGLTLIGGPTGLTPSTTDQAKRVIYIDRNTGKPLWPMLTSSGQLILGSTMPPPPTAHQLQSTMSTMTLPHPQRLLLSPTHQLNTNTIQPQLQINTTDQQQPAGSSTDVMSRTLPLLGNRRRPAGPPPPAPEHSPLESTSQQSDPDDESERSSGHNPLAAGSIVAASQRNGNLHSALSCLSLATGKWTDHHETDGSHDESSMASHQSEVVTPRSRSSSSGGSSRGGRRRLSTRRSKSRGSSSSSSTTQLNRPDDHSSATNGCGVGRCPRVSSRHQFNATYQLIDDLVMIERTFSRDISLLCYNFRSELTESTTSSSSSEHLLPDQQSDSVCGSKLPPILSKRLFHLLDPVFTQHHALLGQLEVRIRSIDQRDVEADFGRYRIGDILVDNLTNLDAYEEYLGQVPHLLIAIEAAARRSVRLDQALRRFEAQKTCYLPFYAFLLKPMHRLLQYRASIERLIRQYGETHSDVADCRAAHSKLLEVIQRQWEAYKKAENVYQLLEIQRDLVGLTSQPPVSSSPPPLQDLSTAAAPSSDTSLADSGPLIGPWQFLRQGWLQKLTKKGHQPRMFFLFSDQLVYASRTNAPYLQFKVHGQFRLHDLMVEEVEGVVQHGFTIFSGNRCFQVAAASDWQRDRWLEDISRAILAAKTKSIRRRSVLASDEPSSTTQGEESSTPTIDSNDVVADSTTLALQQRATTSVHVCWHRNHTFAAQDVFRANEYQTSGYLLRKFKNSSGWQRLWVVFARNCLFFFKSSRDDSPLASLPLLGYSVVKATGFLADGDVQSPPDNHQDVIRLQFKNHVYFFRCDNQTSFDRWLEYLTCATGVSRQVKT